MGKTYYIYECCRRWGTKKTGWNIEMECEKCHRFSRPIESSPLSQHQYRCACGAAWSSPRSCPSKCQQCGETVSPIGSGNRSTFMNSSSASVTGSTTRRRRRPSSDEYLTNHGSGDSNLHSRNGNEQEFVRFGTDFGPESQQKQQQLGSPSDQSKRKVVNEAECFLNKGNRCYMDGKYDQALRNFTEAIKLHPDPQYYKYRSMAYMKMERIHEAQEDLRKSLQECRESWDQGVSETPREKLKFQNENIRVIADSPANRGMMFTSPNTERPISTSHDEYDEENYGRLADGVTEAIANASIAEKDDCKLNVRIMNALYRHNFHPVHLAKVLGLGIDSRTLQSIVQMEMPAALHEKNIVTFDPSTGLCSISPLPQICQKERECAVKSTNCASWHICQRYLLGCCLREHCMRNHSLTFGTENQQILRQNGLVGVDSAVLRFLLISQHRPSTLQPQICYNYYRHYCSRREGTCYSLHVCRNIFTKRCPCKRSHDLFDEHNLRIMKYFNVDMDDTRNMNDIEDRIALWNPTLTKPVRNSNSNPTFLGTTIARGRGTTRARGQQGINANNDSRSDMAEWKYKTGDSDWTDFAHNERNKLEDAFCDVKQNYKEMWIKQKLVKIDLDQISAYGNFRINDNLVVQRQSQNDQWEWYYGSGLSKKWEKMVGEEGHVDIHQLIEEAYVKFREDHTLAKITVEDRLIQEVTLDFKEWTVNEPSTGYTLGIRRRPVCRR